MAKKSRIGNWVTRIFKPSEAETTYLHKGEILVVFLMAYFIAMSLWLLVNMTKEYSLTISVPLLVTEYSEDMAFVSDPPAEARVGVSGEGWNLLSLYRNPPEITIPYSEGEVSISDMVQGQFASYSDISIQKVEPARINLKMEPKSSARVPVRPELDIQLKPQFEILGRIRVAPDSVTVSGAGSVIDTLRSIATETLRLRNVQTPVQQRVALKQPAGLILGGVDEVTVSFDVTEFTEGEVRLYLEAMNVPDGREVRFNPTTVTIRYHVPIEQFGLAQEMEPYHVYVEYTDIERDTTGYVVPRVEAMTDELDLRLHAIQPRRVSYFQVVPE